MRYAFRRLTQLLLPAAAALPCAGQKAVRVPAEPETVSISGTGATTWVLITGVMGGVAGFRRLQADLVARGSRVVVVDPYAMSLDSTDVSFAALARRVEVALTHAGVDSARVVGHGHGGGVALRLAADPKVRVTALYLLDVGAMSRQKTKVFSHSLSLVPTIVKVPGGKALVRSQIVRGLRKNSARTEWLDTATQRAYTGPFIDRIDRIVAMAHRLRDVNEPEPVTAVVSRIHVPVTVLLGEAQHPAAPDPAELGTLSPLGSLLHVERLPGLGHFMHEEAAAVVVLHLTRPR